MPAVKPGSKVLVTGASGFIAAWVVKTLLERGFHVRGTVRSAAKGEFLANLFKEHSDRFEYIVVDDIAKDGAFDDAVKGMDAVEHIASPFHFKAEDPDDLIIPAVKGTSGVLESIRKHGSFVQRVVITSSVAAVAQPSQPPDNQKTFTEKDWNNFSLQEVDEKGREAAAIHKYRASKTLAERAAWNFVEKHKGEIKWDITTLNPPFAILAVMFSLLLTFHPPRYRSGIPSGQPTIHEIPTASSINTSNADVYALIKGRKEPSATPGGNWVDIRDLAVAHVEAITTEKAGGQRFLVASGPFTFQDILDEIHAGSASDSLSSSIPKGTPGRGKNVTHPVLLDTTKARTVLGLKFRNLSETAKDTARSLLEREKSCGW